MWKDSFPQNARRTKSISLKYTFKVLVIFLWMYPLCTTKSNRLCIDSKRINSSISSNYLHIYRVFFPIRIFHFIELYWKSSIKWRKFLFSYLNSFKSKILLWVDIIFFMYVLISWQFFLNFSCFEDFSQKGFRM